MGELRKCSRCHSTKLEEYFSLNNKGELFKLCDNCRSKHKDYYKIWNANNKDKLAEMQAKSFQKWLDKPLDEQYRNCECGGRFRYKAKHLLTKQHQEYLEINAARQQFISDVIEKSDGDLEYEGLFNPEDFDGDDMNINIPLEEFKEQVGDKCVEDYHIFFSNKTFTSTIVRWRFNQHKSQ